MYGKKKSRVLHAHICLVLTAVNNCKFTNASFRGIFTRQSKYVGKILSFKILTVPRNNCSMLNRVC